MPPKELVISAASWLIVAVLPGCSAGGPAGGSPPHASVPSADAAVAFTVAGVHPVLPNGSQDTHPHAPKAGCDGATFAADQALGVRVAGGFALAGFPASAPLLRDFLDGKGKQDN